LILHPSSHHIFDSYCHPDWLPARSRKKFDKYRQEHGDEEEEWTRKVLLKESWVGKCIEAGRFLVRKSSHFHLGILIVRGKVMTGEDVESEGESFHLL